MDYEKINKEIRRILEKHGKAEHVNYYDQLFMFFNGELFNRLTARRKRINKTDFEEWLKKNY